MDNLTPERRSWNMRRIRGRNTKPERIVRSLLHQAGYRFTVNGPKNQSLPGRPDLVLPRHRAVVFVHGCYWHRHKGCRYAYQPKSRVDFWTSKFEENIRRDRRNVKDLKALGWKVIVIWECQTRSEELCRNIPEFVAQKLSV